MSPAQALMLVSADAGDELRAEVGAQRRACPDFLRLEERHGVRLLDWSGLGTRPVGGSIGQSLRHVGSALRQMDQVDVVFSDSERVGLPLALAMRARRRRTPHLMIGHHLGNPRKASFFRVAKVQRRIDRILVHSPNQLDLLHDQLGLADDQIKVVPYGVDTEFWDDPGAREDGDLVASAGREHRDYRLLVEAVGGRCRLFMADASAHNAHAQRSLPEQLPHGAQRRGLGLLELRQLYGRASIVVVPLLATSYPFGITTLLEAMSMGKAVVVSDTEGLRGVIDNGRTGLVVPPGDGTALRDAVLGLLDDPRARARLGAAARKEAVLRFGLNQFVDALGAHLRELSGRTSSREQQP
jgi:glycosyltransferase involved in cell wall biosynthesis